MKYGYMALLIIASIFALVYGLIDQIGKQYWWAFAYVVIVLFGSTSMYLVGWKFSKLLSEKKDDNQNK
jgi:hypothetical protein